MGRMHDALRKAAEERERKRRQSGDPRPPEAAPVTTETDFATAEVVPVTGVQARTEAIVPLPSSRVTAPPPSAPSRTPDFDVPTLGDDVPRSGRAERAIGKRARETAADRAREQLRQEASNAAETARVAARVDQRIVAYHSPREPGAEQFRNIRASLLSLVPLPRTILLTSGSPGEGKSVASVNLAAILAEGTERRILLVDANLRQPELASLVGADPGPGLSEALEGGVANPADFVQRTPIAGVDLFPAGVALDNPGALLATQGFGPLLARVAAGYDFVVVDSPALEGVADAAVIAPTVDGVLLVVRIGGPSREGTERALELLEQARARVLGAVATRSKE